MRILVTGASGFLGRHVVRALAARGDGVRGTDRVGAGPVEGAGEWIEADLASDPIEPLVRGVGAVIHVAGLFDLAAPDEALHRANVVAAERVARAARRAGVRRFVHVSSVTVIGRPRRAGVREDEPTRPSSPYERSKLAGERAVRAIEGLPLAVVRPSGIYGPHGRYGVAVMAATLALAAARGRGHRSVRGGPRMTHVHVEDVASACLSALDDPRAIGGTFHVADSTPVAWGEIAEVIERFYGLSERDVLRVTPLRARALQLITRLAARRVARTNASMRRGWDALAREHDLVPALVPRIDADAYDYWRCDHVYDTSALRVLGWTPRWPDARDGLEATLQWYVAQRWLPAPR